MEQFGSVFHLLESCPDAGVLHGEQKPGDGRPQPQKPPPAGGKALVTIF